MTVQMDNLVGEARRIYAPVGFVELPARPGLYRNHVKRIADLTFVIVTAPLVLPAILVLALVLALQGHSPFYFSDRVGRGGRERTRGEDAEREEQRLREAASAHEKTSPVQSIDPDPVRRGVARYSKYPLTSRMSCAVPPEPL